MFQTLRKFFAPPKNQEIVQTRSVAWAPLPVSPNSHPLPSPADGHCKWDDCTLLPGADPRILFPILRRIRDYIPDVSAGIWAWVRLCSTQQSYSFSEGSEAEQTTCRSLLRDLDDRILGNTSGQEKGIESLVQAYFLSVFTYGSFCGEVVLSPGRKRIDRFIIIDPASIRFKSDPITRNYHPCQILDDGTLVKLNPASFFYHGLDTDGLSPYGRSPLLALPLVIKLQQQMLHDMARAQHNAGYPMVHFSIIKPEKINGETAEGYQERLETQITSIRDEVKSREADSNLITFDNVSVQYIGPSGNTLQWPESLQAITEQVISALHLAPFMIGRNWGTTQTWGTAQYQLLTNNARTVQEGAKRLAEWLRNLELFLQGSAIRVTHLFAPHHHLDVLDRTKAFETIAKTLVDLKTQGILDPQTVRQRIDAFLQFL